MNWEEKAKRYSRLSFVMFGMGFLTLLLIVAYGSASLSKLQNNSEENHQLAKETVRILTSQNEELKKQNAALQQQSEIIICLSVFQLGVDEVKQIFPGADVERCKQRLQIVNNADGTFLSGDADGVFPPGQAPQQKGTSTSSSGGQGPVMGLLNSVKEATDVLNGLRP